MIARAGSFLRDGDSVRPVLPEAASPDGAQAEKTLGSVSEIE